MKTFSNLDIKAMMSNVVDFITTDIWRIRLKDLSFRKSFLIKQLRIVILAIRGFDEDKCLLRASSLTFYTLLSVVPVVAMLFGVAKGFGFEKLLEKQLLEKFPGQEEVLGKVIGFAQALLEDTKGGIIAGIGLVVLFWSVIKVLSHIESSFNDIWEIKENRHFARKFSDYLAIMLISPIFVIMSGSVTVFITTHVAQITQKVSLISMFSPLIFFMLKLLPYLLIWVLFTFIYLIMPNTKVKFVPGFLGGVIAGTIYQFVQWGYISFQVGAAKYNAIYGSFAALPLFLIWLQISWLIVLFGAEIAFANQNVDTYEYEPDCLKVSLAYKKLLSLHITHALIQHFSNGEKPLTAPQISHGLQIPIRLVNHILNELVESGLVSETKTKVDKEFAYQPARDINQLSIKFVLEALEQKGTDNIPVAETEELAVLSDSLQKFSDVTEQSPANKLLKDI